MNKKVLFTNGPKWATLKDVTDALLAGISGRYTYDSIEAMKSQWIGLPEAWDTSKIYRITIEEVDKEGNVNG